MKQNNVKIYAKALAEVALKKGIDEKKVINNFVRLLAASGMEKKSKEILDLAQDMLLAKHGKRRITFQTARDMTLSQKKLVESFVKDGDVVKEKINPELIAGIKIIINDSQQFDQTMQSKLSKIL